MAKVTFRVSRRWGTYDRPSPGRVDVYLESDKWDDFGYVTMFHVHIALPDEVHDLGEVKILYQPAGAPTTARNTSEHLEPTFSSLDPQLFCSLGQTVDYYLWMKRQGNVGRDILVAFADLCARDDRDQWVSLDAFESSLVRHSDARKAFEEGPALLAGSRTRTTDLSFIYQRQLPGASEPHRLHFIFRPQSIPPRRINVLIGPNGAGKSTVLTSLAQDLQSSTLPAHHFPSRPSRRFSRQILVSTSPFDVARRPDLGDKSGYRFVGLRWRFESLIAEIQRPMAEEWSTWLARRFPDSTSLLRELSADALEPPTEYLAALSDRKQDWKEVLSKVLDDVAMARLLEAPRANFSGLSAGQQSLVTTLSGLSATMDDESLVLIDEPENHLHPRFLGLFMRSLSRLLRDRNCYAIIATHSPLVLQEVPTDVVSILSRDGTIPRVRRLKFQSFGASFAALSLDVFRIDDTRPYWYEQLVELAHTRTFEEVCDLFDPPLEPEVMTYLRHELEARTPPR